MAVAERAATSAAVSEAAARERLGIPSEARQVLVLTETSHWDPDWLLTSEGYYRLRVRRNLRQAVRQLLADPRRVYSVECIFFLRMFFERNPQLRQVIRQLANERRLRLLGCGVTTPDTIIPPTELLVRDYLLGQQWLIDNGIDVEPEVAYFPDTFGFSPGLPEVLASLGITAAGICRIDGMYFVGNETERPRRFPRPGSSAARLLSEHRTLDFVWQGPDGGRVLTHWLAFTYGQGEMLGHLGLTRQVGAPLAVPWPTDSHVARMVERYVGQLAPLARTPYLYCPIGFDFSAPIRHLGELIERYNHRHFKRTGTWVINAGFDDYMALIAHHRHRLPVLELDPSQYFTGFFTSRPTLKRSYHQLADTLLLTERLSLAADAPQGAPERVHGALAGSWWTATTANHHDYVTGTAPDRVARREQQPWLDDAMAAAARTLRWVAAPERAQGQAEGDRTGEPAASADAADPTADGAPPPQSVGTTSWRRRGQLIEVETPTLRLSFDEARGGALVGAATPSGTALLGPGTSLAAAAYVDSGGLWRMGHEYAGGRLAPVDWTSRRLMTVTVETRPDGTVVLCGEGTLDGRPYRQWTEVDPTDQVLRIRGEVTLGPRRLATVRLVTCGETDRLTTDVPGGVVTRPARRWFDPTFWAVQSFAAIRSPADPGRGLAVLLELPGAVALRPAGRRRGEGPQPRLELIAARNATKELAYGLLPLPAQPARGHDPGPHRFAFTLHFSEAEVPSHQLLDRARQERRRARVALADGGSAGRGRRQLEDRAEQVVQVLTNGAGPEVVVTAAKLAHRGPGVVVRLWNAAAQTRRTTLRWTGWQLAGASWCDGRERDLDSPRAGETTSRPEGWPIEVRGDTVTLDAPAGISSLRLIPHTTRRGDPG